MLRHLCFTFRWREEQITQLQNAINLFAINFFVFFFRSGAKPHTHAGVALQIRGVTFWNGGYSLSVEQKGLNSSHHVKYS